MHYLFLLSVGKKKLTFFWVCLPSSFAQSQRHVSDLYEDLRDGHNLISLLEVLSGESLVSISHVHSVPSSTVKT